MARQSQLGAGGGVLPRLVLSRPTHAPSRQDTPRRFPPTNDRGRASSGNGWDQLRLPRPDPCLGTVAERQGYGQASHSQKPLCPRGGRGERLVSATPARVHPRPAPTPVLDDAEPLRLLRRRQQHSTIAMVRPSGVRIWRKWLSRRDRQGVVRWTRLNEILTPSSAVSQDRPRIRRRERISLVRNRMREIRTSGSVRDGDGNVPIYSAMTPLGESATS